LAALHDAILPAQETCSVTILGGFAHGFQTLTENCELIYLHNKPYAPQAEGRVNALDPKLAMGWPLPVSRTSQRDRDFRLL
jgi:dTDP-4-dehydrorhamnose 3,5-epimerase